MKKLVFVTLALVLVATFSYSAAFTPTLLKITANEQIIYEFGGKTVEIPFSVTTPISVWFLVTTKGKSQNIVGVRNGHMGWHYVNKIDTTIYLSPRFEKVAGATTIKWEGKDKNGNNVEAGEYYYYLWGFDEKTSRKEACHFMSPSSAWDGECTHYFDYDYNGMALDPPYIINKMCWWNWTYFNVDDRSKQGAPQGAFPIGTVFKWQFGNDPIDMGLLQTTFVSGYLDYNLIKGNVNMNMKDTKYFYITLDDVQNKLTTLQKYEWVTNGDAKLVEDWGGWDNFTWSNPHLASCWSNVTPIFTDNYYLYMPFIISEATPTGQDTPLYCVDHDGNQVFFKKDFPGWFFPDSKNADGSLKIPNLSKPILVLDHSDTQKNLWGTNNRGRYALGECLHQVSDFSRILSDPEDNTDLVVWENSNGDYYLDTNSKSDAATPWDCIGWLDLSSRADAAYMVEGQTLDKHNFLFCHIASFDLIEIGAFTPDGTGIGEYMKWSDSVSMRKSFKSARYVQNGGKYDGLYTNGIHPLDTNDIVEATRTMFVGADSFRGVITNEPATAVEEDAAAAFSVAQNAPNPFNPTTTISFTIPKAGNVLVDVYSVAGQKVATLANGTMNAGTHSVVWDASGFSAGVYFYTVKAGNFTRTMKMTLLK